MPRPPFQETELQELSRHNLPHHRTGGSAYGGSVRLSWSDVHQPRKTERVKVSNGKGQGQGRAVHQTPWAMGTAGGLCREVMSDVPLAQVPKPYLATFPLLPDHGSQSVPHPCLQPLRRLYPLPVPQASVLPSASFRFHLAMDTLAVRLTLSLAGCVEDFHLQVSAPCRAHQKKGRDFPRGHRILSNVSSAGLHPHRHRDHHVRRGHRDDDGVRHHPRRSVHRRHQDVRLSHRGRRHDRHRVQEHPRQ